MGYYESNELYHHGILGQKWGKKNGPPYPLKASSHSASEKKAGWRKSLDAGETKRSKHDDGKKAADTFLHRFKDRRLNSENDVPNNINHDPQKILGYSDDKYLKAKSIAKVAGIGLGTVAGVMALSCMIDGRNGEALLSKDVKELARTDFSQLLSDINSDPNHPEAFDLDDSLFHNRYNGDYIGKKAAADGYREIDSDFIKDAISDRITSEKYDYDALALRVKRGCETDGAERTLSCWSAANAYYLSALTGHDFVSKSFTNAVDFNKFDKLYLRKPELFDAFGKRASTYVGTFGSDGTRCGPEVASSLAENILKQVSSKNNLTPDGTRSIGFINAGYHSSSMPHQWNFEVYYDWRSNSKELTIAEGYGGYRYKLGKMLSNGTVELNELGLQRLAGELKAYNDDSIRFYAPSLEDINPSMMANVILGKT